MKRGIKYWFRWLAVLPGALMAGIISTFLLHLILAQTLKHFIEPYPEFPERALTPFVVALTIIRAACEIAPEYKLRTGVFFFAILIFFAGGLIFLTLAGNTWVGKSLHLQGGGIGSALGIIGAFIGLFLVKKKLNNSHPLG